MSHVTIIRGWQPSAQSSVWFWFRSCFSALRPEIRQFRIHKNCYFPVKFVVSAIIFVQACLEIFVKFRGVGSAKCKIFSFKFEVSKLFFCFEA